MGGGHGIKDKIVIRTWNKTYNPYSPQPSIRYLERDI